MTTSIPMSNDAMNMVDVSRAEGYPFLAGRERDRALVSRRRALLRYVRDSAAAGTELRITDTPKGTRVAIVNQQLAKHYWPISDPIGKRFRLNDRDKSWVQIIGVWKNSPSTCSSRKRPTPFCVHGVRSEPKQMLMVAQAAGNSSSLVGPLREVVRGLDVNQPIYNVRRKNSTTCAR